MKKFRITFQKTKFLHYDINAETVQEAIEQANDIDEKFGAVVETPYFLAVASEDDAID